MRAALVDSGRQAVIGVNLYPPLDETPIAPRRVDNSAVLATQVERLSRWRASRDPDALAKLPESERREWLALWADVDGLLKKVSAH